MHVYFRMFHWYINVDYYFFLDFLLLFFYIFFCWPNGLHCNSEENQNKTSLCEQIKVFKFTISFPCVCVSVREMSVCVGGGGGVNGRGS